MWKFLNDYKLSQSLESHGLMKQTLEEFRKVSKKAILSDITREDLLWYKQWLVERGRSLRTAGNKMLRVNQFYRAAMGLRSGEGLVTVKDGKFVEKEPEVYTDDELDAFFKACSPFHARVFSTLLMAGLRKQHRQVLVAHQRRQLRLCPELCARDPLERHLCKYADLELFELRDTLRSQRLLR
jgi:integrase